MKIRKLSALLLVLCMIFSLSVAAFAAEADAHTVYDSAPEEAAASAETVTSGTIPGSKIKWELNEHNWLMISAPATVSRSPARPTSRGRLIVTRSRRSGLMIWTHCISLILRTGLKTASA